MDDAEPMKRNAAGQEALQYDVVSHTIVGVSGRRVRPYVPVLMLRRATLQLEKATYRNVDS